MKVCAVLPSRGLIYARTIKGLLENIEAENIIIVEERPMPDCFNEGIKIALDRGAEYIWMVEEDNELPRGTLDALIQEADKGEKIITVDYTVGGNNSHIYRKDGEPLWCGIGCTLIKREVFEAIQCPWFEVDKHLNFKDEGYEILQIPPENVGRKFGGHDSLFFYMKAWPLGYKIKVLNKHLGHFRCKEMPKRELNNGQYTIYSL